MITFFAFFRLANVVLLGYEIHDHYKMVGKPSKSQLQATFFNLWNSCEYLIHYQKVKILILTIRSYYPLPLPQLDRLLRLEQLAYSKCSPPFSIEKTCVFWYPFSPYRPNHIPLKYIYKCVH